MKTSTKVPPKRPASLGFSGMSEASTEMIPKGSRIADPRTPRVEDEKAEMKERV